MRAVVQRIWQIKDSQGQMLALAFRHKSSTPFKLSLPRWAAAQGVASDWCVVRARGDMYIYIYVYMYIYVFMYIYMYVYIYI